MSDKYILNVDGSVTPEADLITWATWFEKAENRHIGDDRIGDVRISTIFLGLDHRFGIERGGPVLFETMVFGGPLDGEQDRYCTKDEAMAGHAAMLARVQTATTETTK